MVDPLMRLRETVVALTIVNASVIILALTSCARRDPPTPAGVDASVSPLPGPNVAALSSSSPSASPTQSSSASATTSSTAVASSLDAGGPDPGALPQTKDKLAATSPALDARAAALWDAIAHDDPDRAMPFFFPVTAYEQVKAIPSPASDWRRRLVAAFKRDVHGLNKRIGAKAESAKLVRLDVPDDRARWVEPNEESNKLGYWRVYGTHIVYESEGKEKTLDISSLISWRGEWYVVHLTGFK